MKKSALLLLCLAFATGALAQTDSTDLLSMLEKEVAGDAKNQTNYATATFKATRLINGHTVENVAAGVLDVKISHRFGKLNSGGYELFGLDNASMRMGLDYGITRYLMVGIGRSTFEKTYDAFFKLKLFRQSNGRRKMPFTISYVPTIALKTLKYEDPDRKNYYTSRLYFSHQLLIGRKFSEGTSLQLMPTYIHRNLVKYAAESNDLFAIGIGGRQKITKRVSINAEYYYQLPGYRLNGTSNSLSLGFDIETGGHVFQLHFTNSRGMNERTFISETTGLWEKGDIYFGFNISRVFTLSRKKR
ncbi:MAG TPA: DUF5777 family beta-barrel protein [Ferruginibacter sp.]|nr:DUF5777 family beta-barrel protein [Ferruginibacter sp.]